MTTAMVSFPAMDMSWFGIDWGAPLNKTHPRVRTPTGVLCFQCQLAIERGDSGYVLLGEPWHLGCFLLLTNPERH
jgi:hypothetical protein